MTLRVHRSALTVAQQPTLRVHESTLASSTPQAVTTLRVHESSLSTPVLPTVEAGLDKLNVEPGTQVTFTATSPDTPDTWTWRQVSGPVVTFTQDGPAVTVTAPYTLNGATVVMGVTCTKDGVTSMEDTVQVGVLNSTILTATDQGYVPVEVLTLV